MDAQAASTDGRATLYANGQTHMFERKIVIKKQGGGFKYKKTKPSIFFFSYLKRYSNTYTLLQGEDLVLEDGLGLRGWFRAGRMV
jgi:hypothetical protein